VSKDEKGKGPQQVIPPPPISKETEDERFLQSTVDELQQRGLFRDGKESWRVFRIMGEFVEGFDELSTLGPCVSVFGSVRLTPADPVYDRCVQTVRLLGEAPGSWRRRIAAPRRWALRP
jgi:hypothetical protein